MARLSKPAGVPAQLFRLWMRRAGAAPAAACLILAVLSSCTRERNTPRQVVEQFLAAVAEGDKSAIDTLVYWERVLLAESYIAWNIFQRYSPEEKEREIARYKEKFYEKDLPVMKMSSYRVKRKRGIVINRDDSDAFINVSFKGVEGTTKQGREFETTLEMKLDASRKMWLITDFGDLVRINMIEGRYDPDSLYLNKPVR
ncbi:MAG: hypothetical protein JXQ83_02425 [Candidatus Glassbacteria bacterium]|nr:hypothetical protein [Candidatus Glassbacteria bacterium]